MVYRSMRNHPYGCGTRTVYLIHFSRPLAHAAHYIGQTERAGMAAWEAVEARLAEHRAGRGAKLTRAAVAAGIELQLAVVWPDAPRCFEQVLKNRGGGARAYPVCLAEKAKRAAFREPHGPERPIAEIASAYCEAL